MHCRVLAELQQLGSSQPRNSTMTMVSYRQSFPKALDRAREELKRERLPQAEQGLDRTSFKAMIRQDWEASTEEQEAQLDLLKVDKILNKQL